MQFPLARALERERRTTILAREMPFLLIRKGKIVARFFLQTNDEMHWDYEVRERWCTFYPPQMYLF